MEVITRKLDRAMNIPDPAQLRFENTASIVQRHSDHTDPVVEPAWAVQSKAHCRLMAPMSNDRRIQYLGTAGCDDDTIQLITRTIAWSIGKTAKPSLRSAARDCTEAKKDIKSLLDRWPEPQHFQLLSSQITDLSEEQISLASAYAACQIYETAATALYLATVDSMAGVAAEEASGTATIERDRAIADAGYTDEVAQWPK